MQNLRGQKTKLLWQNPEYRKHMSEAHKGHVPKNKGNFSQICPVCKNNFHVKKCLLDKKKYCSKKCYTFSQKGNIPWNKKLKGYTTTKKGKKFPHIIPWNKGKKGVMPIPWNKGKHIYLGGGFKKGHIPWIKGKKHSPETIAKIKRFIKGRKVWNRGKKGIYSQETLSKMSLASKGRPSWNKGKKFPQISGNKHHNWKGGCSSINEKLRKSIEYQQWREAVFKRDKFTCQKCFKIGGKLHAHHKKSFSKYPLFRFDINNGITLCKLCHLKHYQSLNK